LEKQEHQLLPRDPRDTQLLSVEMLADVGNATDCISRRNTFCLSLSPAMRTGLHVSRQCYKQDYQRCWWRCISLRQLVQVDIKHRGGWTQMLGSEVSEPLSTNFLIGQQDFTYQRCIWYFHGAIPFEYQQDIWHQKTRAPGLSCGIVAWSHV